MIQTADLSAARASLELEIDYARKWGIEFDDDNTPNDWAAYIALYTGKAIEMTDGRPDLSLDCERFRQNMIKVASLALHAVAAVDRGGPALRHYDA